MHSSRFSPDRLRSARKSKNLAQDKLANRIGADVMTISRWENGKTAPKSEDLSKLAEVLGVEPAWFFMPDESAVADPERPGAFPWAQSLASLRESTQLSAISVLAEALISSDNPLDYDRALWDRTMDELQSVTPGALRSTRDHLSLSVADVSQLTGIASSRITELETSTGIPVTPSEIMKLRAGLGVAFEPRAVAYSGLSLQNTKDKRSASVRLAESKRVWETQCQRTPNKLDSIMAMLLEMRRELNELKQEVRGRQH